MAVVPLEILSLLWSHPILTGLVILLFTTPLFHIVLFFTPLLMSTALCVIALVSIGPQIEKIREERQFKMSVLHARSVNVAIERPVNRHLVLRQGRPQRPAGGRRRWADWVKGIEIHGNTIWLSETHIMRDIADEGLKADFTHEDGGIAMTREDFGGLKAEGAFATDKLDLVGADESTDESTQLQLVEVKAPEDQHLVVTDEQEVIGLDDDDDDGVEVDAVEKQIIEAAIAAGLELVSVEETSSKLEVPNVEETLLGKTPRRNRKKKPWFRRRRIPCLSKALGQLREKIYSQIKRIFS